MSDNATAISYLLKCGVQEDFKANQNDLTCLILKLKIHQIFLKNHLMKLQLRIYAANC